jgi:glycosyltransferase involved in cell wall biosynthesis
MWNVLGMLRAIPDVEYHVLAMNTARHWVEPETLPMVYGTIPYAWAPVDNRITPLGALKNLLDGTPYHITRFWSRAFDEELRRVLQDVRPDVVLLEGLPMALYVQTIRRVSNAAIVYHAHNIEHKIWERLAEADRNPMRRLYLQEQVRRLRRYECMALARGDFDAVVTFTHVDAQRIRELGFRGLIHVKPFALSLEQYVPSYAPEANPTLFHLGSLEWQPNRQGIEWFLEQVFPIVRRQLPSAELHLGGYIPRSVRLSEGNGVRIYGRVPDAKEFMRQRSILIVPLLAGSGVRIKIIEAMALGKAVVSTSIGVEGIGAGAGSEYLVADTAEEFAQHLCMLCRHPQQIDIIGRNARGWVERHHDHRSVGEGLAAFLTRVAAERAAHAE